MQGDTGPAYVATGASVGSPQALLVEGMEWTVQLAPPTLPSLSQGRLNTHRCLMARANSLGEPTASGWFHNRLRRV